MLTIYTSKRLSYAIIIFLNFLSGIEYAVILPTALKYLKLYNGNEFDLGMCLSAYSFSSLFSSPLFGYWSDKINNTKSILLFANVWQIVGSFMYFIGYSKWFILSGRLVAGVGLGALACCFSEVVKTTKQEERGKILSYVMMGRQLGLIIGPSLNFLVFNLKFYIGPFYFYNLSAPGFLMAALWLLLEILIILFYKNLNEFGTENDNEIEQDAVNDERRRLLGNENDNNNQNDNIRINIVDNSDTGSFSRRLYDEYIREEVIAVISITFTVFFMQTALETLLTPLVSQYFDWGDKENSIVYACAGLEILLVFIILSYLNKHMSERYLLLIGLLSNLVSLVYFIIYVPHIDEFKGFLKVFLLTIPVIINIWSIPLIALGSISILSKLTSLKSQGRTQGIRRSVVGIACILGPIWCGLFYSQWYFLFGSLILIVSLPLCMLVSSFKYIKPIEQ